MKSFARILWQNGQYDTKGDGSIIGMRLARKLGMISYRSGQEWLSALVASARQTADRHAFGIDFEVESILKAMQIGLPGPSTLIATYTYPAMIYLMAWIMAAA